MAHEIIYTAPLSFRENISSSFIDIFSPKNIPENNLDIFVFIVARSFYPYTHYNIYKDSVPKDKKCTEKHEFICTRSV